MLVNKILVLLLHYKMSLILTQILGNSVKPSSSEAKNAHRHQCDATSILRRILCNFKPENRPMPSIWICSISIQYNTITVGVCQLYSQLTSKPSHSSTCLHLLSSTPCTVTTKHMCYCEPRHPLVVFSPAWPPFHLYSDDDAASAVAWFLDDSSVNTFCAPLS